MATHTRRRSVSGQDADCCQIEVALRKVFDRVEVYRHNSASIRVRIIHAAFEDQSRSQREERVFPVLERLPERVYTQIIMLLLLTPAEAEPSKFNRYSLMNLEFDQESPSRL